MNEILQYLKKHGDRSDKEIAEATGIPLVDVHLQLSELAARSQAMLCQSTKFIKGKEITTIICRIAGYLPPAKLGSNSKVNITLS